MEAVDRKKVVVGTTEEHFGSTVRGNLVLIDEPTGMRQPPLTSYLISFFVVRSATADAFVAQATLCCCRPSSRGSPPPTWVYPLAEPEKPGPDRSTDKTAMETFRLV